MTDRGTGTGGSGGGRINHFFGQNDQPHQQQYQPQAYQPPYQQAQGAYQQPPQPQYYAAQEARPSLPPRHGHSHSHSSSSSGSSSRPHTVPPPQTGPYDRPPIPGAFPGNPAPPVTPYPYPPTVNPPPTRTLFSCDSCSTNLTHRPRIKCIQCPNFDLCTTCYLLRRTASKHESWHSQQTILPPPPLARHQINPNAVFNCDVCNFDISASPRARCLECVNFDLCADCHVMKLGTKDGSGGATGKEGHLPTHKMNVITDWQPETREKLVNEEFYPSNLYLDMIDAIFNFIFENYHPPMPEAQKSPGSNAVTTFAPPGGSSPSSSSVSTSTNSTSSSGASSIALSLLSLTGHAGGAHRRRKSSTTDRSAPGGPSGGSNGGGFTVPNATNSSTTPGATSASTPTPADLRISHELLDARKLALFYRAMGMLDTDNHYLTLPPPRLIHLYSVFGLEYHLIPSPALRVSLSNRVFPWQIDHIDTTPTEPALTRAGFRRSFVLGTFLNPEGTHFILQNLLSTGGLVNPITGRVFRAWVPRDTLPRRPLEELLKWEKGLGLAY